MDILNDYYPLYPPNPEIPSDSEESEENHRYVHKLDTINTGRKRKKIFSFDDFYSKLNKIKKLGSFFNREIGIKRFIIN